MKRPNFNALPEKETTWTKGEVIQLYNLLRSMRGIRGVQFLKIVALLLDEIQTISEALSVDKCVPSFKDFNEYQNQISKLQRKHSIITDKDIIENNSYQAELRKLNADSEKMIEEYNQDMQEYNLMLDEPFTERPVNWKYFKASVIPENLPSEIYLMISRLIKE